MPPKKKGATKAGEASTSTARPEKKPAAKATAPKLAAKPKATKAKTKEKTAAAKQTTKQTPSKKSLQEEAAAKAKGTASTKPKTAPLDRPTLPGEIPPDSKVKRPATSAKATGTAAPKSTNAPPAKPKQPAETPQQSANTSRKRKSATIDENEEVEPVATRTARKKVKPDSRKDKRKATADANKKPRKVARVDEQDAPEAATPNKKKKPASSKPKTKSSTAAATADAKKKVRKPAAPKAQKAEKLPPAKLRVGVQINFAPTQPLDVFIFGSGESGELGLGNKKVDGKKPVNVKRPRNHPLLPAEAVGVVQIACGGMHSVALTKDNKILTWGVNDQGALGRDTTWDGGLRDADAEDDDDNGDDFEALNPIECTPAEVSTKNFLDGTKFVKVVASDSASFALTEDGRLYGWGTFRVSS